MRPRPAPPLAPRRTHPSYGRRQKCDCDGAGATDKLICMVMMAVVTGVMMRVVKMKVVVGDDGGDVV